MEDSRLIHFTTIDQMEVLVEAVDKNLIFITEEEHSQLERILSLYLVVGMKSACTMEQWSFLEKIFKDHSILII